MRLTADLTPDEMREEIYDLRRELRPRIREIREFSKVSRIPQYAVKDMARLETAMRKTSVRDMDEKQLRNTLRDLRYIESLETSTLEGAIETQEKFEPFKEKLEKLPEHIQQKYWDIYDEFYHSVGKGMEAERFKYEVFQSELINLMEQLAPNFTYSDDKDYKDPEVKRLSDLIEKAYREMTLITNESGDLGNARLLFTNELAKLFPKFD